MDLEATNCLKSKERKSVGHVGTLQARESLNCGDLRAEKEQRMSRQSRALRRGCEGARNGVHSAPSSPACNYHLAQRTRADSP